MLHKKALFYGYLFLSFFTNAFLEIKNVNKVNHKIAVWN